MDVISASPRNARMAIAWGPGAQRELLPAGEPAAVEEPVAVEAPVAVPRTGLRALTLAERLAAPAGPLQQHLRILGSDEARTRKLRQGTDPALIVSCWSDAEHAQGLDAE